MEQQVEKNWQEKLKYSEKFFHLATLPQIPHNVTWDAMMEGQLLTTWGMAWFTALLINSINNIYYL